MFAIRMRAVLLCVFFPCLVHANFSGGDDFNDNSVDSTKWGSDEIRNFGTFAETNQRLEFTGTMTANTIGMVLHHWTANYGSYTENWSAQVDVSLSSLALGSSDLLFISLTAANTANSEYNKGGITLRETNAGYFIVPGVQNSPSDTSQLPTPIASGIVSLQVSYDSATHTLITAYDLDGASNGYLWTPSESYDLSPWNMTDSSQFQLEIVAGGISATTRTIMSGQVTADNLAVTPEPSTLGLLGLAVFALLATSYRRRHAKISHTQLT